MEGQLIINGLSLEQFISKLSEVVRIEAEDAFRKIKADELQDKLLTPKEACKVFHPAISLPTLTAWSEAGHFEKRHIGGRTFYRYGDLINCGRIKKKFSRQS
jgi:hypothetical protein